MAEQSFKKRLAHKALMPIVATAASAAASYLAKRGPALFEEKILPKLKDAAGTASEMPARAKEVAGDAGEMAQSLASRAGNTVQRNGASGSNGSNGGLSSGELEKHVKERAEARAARRKSTRKSGS